MSEKNEPTISRVKFEDIGLSTSGNIKVTAEMSDGSTKHVFDYYSDELFFVGTDFVGKTIDEALELKYQRDVAYLQS